MTLRSRITYSVLCITLSVASLVASHWWPTFLWFAPVSALAAWGPVVAAIRKGI